MYTGPVQGGSFIYTLWSPPNQKLTEKLIESERT